MYHEDRNVMERQRNIIYLIYEYLFERGFVSTANSLKNEANLDNTLYTVCDNVDLDTVYLEYCSYFHFKFGKYPRILKQEHKDVIKPKINKTIKTLVSKKKSETDIPSAKSSSAHNIDRELSNTLLVRPISCPCSSTTVVQKHYRPLKEYENYTLEWHELAEMVCRDLIRKSFGLNWKDIYGNSKAISTIKEAVLLPLYIPELFKGNLKPWRAVLLHGPPGTGKTLIAKVLCSEAINQASFFNVSSSTIISKWRGESEKIIRVLFEVAQFYAPSIIFIDEIEGLTSRRDYFSEHEASKRFKNEFLALLDGIVQDNAGIFVLANTNLPWEIDPAFLRRFERKILTELPTKEDRKLMITNSLQEMQLPTNSLDNFVKVTEGFTGDEIRIAFKEIAMKKIRHTWDSKKGKNAISQEVSTKNIDEDILDAFQQIKPIGPSLIVKHRDWNIHHGNKF